MTQNRDDQSLQTSASACMANQHGYSGSVFGAAMYMSHYICKDESQALKRVIADNLALLPEEASVRSRLSKIGNTLLSHRQLSQQEAAFLMTGLHLKGSSRATVFVSTVPEECHTRLVRPSSQLRELRR